MTIVKSSRNDTAAGCCGSLLWQHLRQHIFGSKANFDSTDSRHKTVAHIAAADTHAPIWHQAAALKFDTKPQLT